MKLKNIAIVAHVDHGKTTLVDGLISQSETLGERETISERVMDSGDLERERGITISAKNCSIRYKDHKINVLDTPGHADFGGEVERSLMMVDGVFLLVDAAEGPLPQTRFVLTKAMEQDIKIAVIINKVDRPDARIDEVKGEVEDLLLELATELEKEDFDVDIPFLYASAKEGWASLEQDTRKENLQDILDFTLSDFFPYPPVDTEGSLQLLVSNLAYSPYLGPLLIGRMQRGKIKRLEQVTWVGKESQRNFKVTSISVYDGLKQVDVDEAQAGEIVIVAGYDKGHIGDSLCGVENVEPLPRIDVEPPTVGVFVSVSTSPLSGKDGDYLTSRNLEDYLIDSCRNNVALDYQATDDPKVYQLKGRGELQLAIVFEELRRKGYEFMVSRPQVLFKEEDGQKTEPFEKVVLDIPSDSTGAITEELNKRKGMMDGMAPIGENRTRVEFIIPSRGLIGYRSKFLTDTRGEGLMSSYYVGYKPYAGDMNARTNGALVSDRTGSATPYALFQLLSNGHQFIEPGDQVYEGMVVGVSKRTNDLNVNVCKEKGLSNVRTAGKDENIILPPVPPRTLDWALDFIDNDEWVEVTPNHVRVRKKTLKANERSVIRTKK